MSSHFVFLAYYKEYSGNKISFIGVPGTNLLVVCNMSLCSVAADHFLGPCRGSDAKSPASHRVGPGSIAVRLLHVIFLVDKVALGQVYLRILCFSPIRIIQPMPHLGLPLPNLSNSHDR